MRAKPISFAQVLKSKGRTAIQTQPTSQSRPSPSPSLSKLMQQYQNAPQEDYTLYLAPLSKARPTSFRAMASRTSNNDEEIFDSWIQRQSIVSNKENLRLVTSKNQLQPPQKDQKKIMLTSQGRESREPLRSVADLVRKIELTESTNNPFFKSNSRPHHEKQQEQTDQKSVPRGLKQNQQTSLTNSNQYEIKLSAPPVKQPQKINVQPYIEQPTAVKQPPKRKEEINDLIAQTEHIHVEIAELAHKYLQEQQQMEDSLLIQCSQQGAEKGQSKENSPGFLHIDEENDLRWQTAKNKVTSYLRKITQEEPKQPPTLPKTQFSHPIKAIPQIEQYAEHPGYSFAIKETEQKPENNYNITLNSINIPQIQEIQSERMPFENYNYMAIKTPEIEITQPPIPENPCIPSTESIKFQTSPQRNYEKNELCSPELEMSAKRISSSLVFSSNPKDTPSPEIKQEIQQNNSNSGQQHVTLSFTEEKPEIVVNIPLDYAEDAEEFQIQTVQVRPEYLEEPYICSPSPDKDKWQGEYAQEEYASNNQAIPLNAVIADEIANQEEIAEQKDAENSLQLQKEVYEVQVDHYASNEEVIQAMPIQEEPAVNVEINEVIDFPKVQYISDIKSLTKQSIDIQQPPMAPSPKNQKTQPQIIHAAVPLLPNLIAAEPIHDEISSQPVIQWKKQSNKNNKNSSGKGSSKGSPSVFGLKKIYSSPNSTPILTQPPVITSAFATGLENKAGKVESFQYKGYAGLKSFERSSKIETLAYTSTYAVKKEEPKVMIEQENEEFQFDF